MKAKILFTLLFSLLFIGMATSQTHEPRKRVVHIKTNAQCSDCKERLESVLNYEKGIIYAELDIDSKDLEIKYDSKKTSLEKIKTIISKIGYDADDVNADKNAQKKLPMCCQPGGH